MPARPSRQSQPKCHRQYMSEEKAQKADESGGVVNPAILTIG